MLQAGVKAGKFLQGHFNPSPYNPLGEVRLSPRGVAQLRSSPTAPEVLILVSDSQATVNSAALPKPVLLASREAMNRAVAGDLVVVELLPESEWKAPNEKVVDADGAFYTLHRDFIAESGKGLQLMHLRLSQQRTKTPKRLPTRPKTVPLPQHRPSRRFRAPLHLRRRATSSRPAA